MEYLIFKTVMITAAVFLFIWQASSFTHSLYESTNYLDVINLRKLSSAIFKAKTNQAEVNKNLDKKRKDLIERVQPQFYINYLGSFVNRYSREDKLKLAQARSISGTKLAFNESCEYEINALVSLYEGVANKKFGGLTVKNIMDMEIAEEIAEQARKDRKRR